MIVIDTSVAIKWAVEEADHESAVALLAIGETFIAPDILLAELANVLRRKQRKGEVTAQQLVDGIVTVRTCISRFLPVSSLIGDVPSLMDELDHSAYDCCFLASAIGRGLLVTADEAFARKCSDRGYGRFVSTVQDFAGLPNDARLGAARIDEALLATIERLSSKIQLTFEALRPPSTSGEFRFVSTDVYEPAFSSPAYVALKKEIEKLRPSELAAIVALGWYGRPEHRIDEWPILHDQAIRFGPDMERQSAYVMAQMPNVAKGFLKLDLWLKSIDPSANNTET